MLLQKSLHEGYDELLDIFLYCNATLALLSCMLCCFRYKLATAILNLLIKCNTFAFLIFEMPQVNMNEPRERQRPASSLCT